MLCPELIGRATEVGIVRSRIADLANGRGGVLALVGEAGAGKSRLLRAATESSTMPILAGRAVPGDTPVPYRPLSEALLTTFRNRPRPEDPSLDGFDAYLGRLVPGWGADAAADDSPLLLGEAIARLLAVVAGDDGCVLVLEDIHWADPETFAVVEYFGDALRDEGVLCVCTARSGSPAVAVLDRLDRRVPGSVLLLDPLGGDAVADMIGACLATTEPPAGLSGFVGEHSDGNPFLVEELLAGLVAAGALRRRDGRWEIVGTLTPAIPASLRDSIARRLAALDPGARRVLGAAALLGRHFEWDLLPGIAEVDGREAVDALRAAVGEQLIEAESDGFSFRHALTREAVLADLLPPERRELAARAWPAIERANPGLAGPALSLAADLAEAAGDPAAAAGLLVESAQRASANGALATAELTARRARDLAVGHPAITRDADEVIVHVLAAAGKSTDAMALGRRLVAELADAGAPAERRADLLVALARAAITAGDLTAAARSASEARDMADTDPGVRARIDAVAAEVALDRADLGTAERLSREAIEGARATDQPAVLCDALLVLGRVERPRDRTAAQAAFREAADVATRADLARWHLRARQELALDAWHSADLEPMHQTRELAAHYGAHITVAVMDLSLADVALSDFDRDGCLRAAGACAEASRRYGLATESVAHLWLAGGHALGGDDEAMHRSTAAALARDPDDPRILGDLYGRVLTTRALVRDEFDEVPPLLDEMMVHVRRAPPTTSVYPGRVLWALVHTIDDDDHGVAARREFHASLAAHGLPILALYGEIVEAVALGRAGDAAGADTRLARPYDTIMGTPMGQGMGRSAVLFVARAAIRDGWGDPVRWLRESEAWFAVRGFDRLVRRCRALLSEAGAPVPRRGRGESEVPESLRALGVTSREVDVLKLVVEGRSTKAIATELYLSPKTVERHLTSLFARTGMPNRRDLATFGADHLT